MKKMKKRNLIIPILILAVLLTVLFFLLMFTGFMTYDRKVLETNEQRFSSMRQTIIDLDEEINVSRDSWIEKNSLAAKIIASSLKNLVTENGYEGPEIFDTGFIIRVNGDEIIYPENRTAYIEDIQLPKTKEEPEVFEGLLQSDDLLEPRKVLYSVAGIADNTYYVDLTEYSEFENAQQIMTDLIKHTLLEIENSYGGNFVILSDETDELLYCSDTLLDSVNLDHAEKLSDLGIGKKDIDTITGILTIGSNTFIASYFQTRFSGRSASVIILIDSENRIEMIAHNILLVIILATVILIGLIFWQFWVRQYVGDHSLTPEQFNNYIPRKVRQTTAAVLLTGSIVIFIVTIFFQALGNLRNEASANRESLDIVINRIEKIKTEKTWYQQEAEEWSAYYSERIAGLFSKCPDLRTKEVLSSINDIIGSDYIILFDSNGDEIESSNAYAGFQLGESDFSKLLLGVDTIVQPPENDPVTGRFLQMTGSPVVLENSNKYGAVIIAASPMESWVKVADNEIIKFVDRITPEGNLCVIAYTDSGEIVYSSDPGLVDEYTSSSGLKRNGKNNSELDYFIVGNNQYYGGFEKADDFVYYFLTDSNHIESGSGSIAFAAAVGFLISGIIPSLILLLPYRTKQYTQAVSVLEKTRFDSIIDQENDLDELDFRTKGFKAWWSDLLPEQKTRFFIHVLTGFILIGIALNYFNPDTLFTRTAIGFVLRGNWSHDFNLLALTAILIMILAFIIYYFFKELLVGILSNVLDSKGLTILRLTSSMIQYGAAVGLLFKALDYLGINTTVMLAGFSALSLAVSLGGKDLVADILAGIFIVFEGDFHVGDFIEVNGYSGIVQEIGVRSTRILGLGDNIKIIGNQSVKNVLNMSKLNSWYTTELTIPSDQPILEIEDMLLRELPSIGERIPEILSGPFYKGIWTINKGTYTLAINAECKEINIRRVQRELNHELIILFTKNGYRIN